MDLSMRMEGTSMRTKQQPEIPTKRSQCELLNTLITSFMLIAGIVFFFLFIL